MSTVLVHADGDALSLDCPEGSSLLDLLRDAGCEVEAPCGGNGTCGKCLVTLRDENGTRRVAACRERPHGDCELWTGAGAQGGVLTTGHVSDAGFEARPGLGVAVDEGTTTVALRLYDLSTGRELGSASGWNAQRPYGADVLTRTAYTMERPGGLALLRDLGRGQIASLLGKACREAGVDHREVREGFIAGNTIMQHILDGRSPASIALAPFTPETLFEDDAPRRWPELPGVELRFAPCAAGYVGGDIVAGLPTALALAGDGPVLYMDVGTNGELALGTRDGLRCCAVASGPAFEGAEISCGMPGVTGAVASASFKNGRWRLGVLGDGEPRGVCGSGLVDVLAELLRLGAVDEGGRLLPPDESPGLDFLEEDDDGNGLCFLTDGDEPCLTARDVRKLQLAKAAVAAGIRVLLREAGIRPDDVATLCLAGGFGNRLNVANAAAIGLLPGELRERVRFVGNGSLSGASTALLCPGRRAELLKLQKKLRYTELSTDPLFSREFTERMLFET